MGDIRSVVDWLTDGARSGALSEDVLAEMCQRMVEAGIPLWRVAVIVNTLHPDVIGRALIWQVDTGVKITAATYDFLETDEYRSSPVVAVRDSRQPIRRHLANWDCPDDFPLVKELRAEGATDYAAISLVFTDGTVHVATWSTREPGGFTSQQLAGLDAVIAPLTRVAEIRALQRTATNLLNTYVGRQAGERILMGKIRRGFVEEIRAIIWLSDMRGFTAFAERLPPQQLVDLLNSYFDCQVSPIVQHGGEVLKFMGDGLLAIFPLAADGSDTHGVCRRALAASRKASALIDALDNPMPEGGAHPFRARAACRRCAVWQHRRRKPARFHLHRSSGQSRGAAGEGRGAIRPIDRRIGGVRRPPAARVHATRRVHRGGLFGAAGGVRLDRPIAMTELHPS